MSTAGIVFFVIAATTPMAAMVGTVPLGFGLGTGAGMPPMYLIAGLIMVCFMTGYAAMSRHIVSTGAMYTYIRAGLGRIAGAGAAYLAVLSYVTFTIGAVGAFGYFADMILAIPGVSWAWYSALLIALMAVLGRRRLDVSVRVLAPLLIAEVLIIVVMNIGIAAHKGASALPAISFDPSIAFGTGLAAAVTFAFTSFIGIESAPLYGEEARDPRKSVARAGFWSVILITIFYTLTSWLAVGGIGADNVSARATDEGGELFFGLIGEYTAPLFSYVMAILLMTSFVATAVALQNAASRYIFALGREHLLPAWLGESHPRFGSPARASTVLSLFTAVVVGGFAVAGLDPYHNLAVSMITLATAGIIVLMFGASLAVIAYFAKRRTDRHWWRTVTAPLLAAVGLGVATVLVLGHYSVLTGTDSIAVNGLPWLIPVVLVAGAGRAARLRTHRPAADEALLPVPDAPTSAEQITTR